MGSSNGQITFYNYQFKLLYWCENRNLDSVRWISFNLRSDLKAPIFKSDESERKLCFDRFFSRVINLSIFKRRRRCARKINCDKLMSFFFPNQTTNTTAKHECRQSRTNSMRQMPRVGLRLIFKISSHVSCYVNCETSNRLRFRLNFTCRFVHGCDSLDTNAGEEVSPNVSSSDRNRDQYRRLSGKVEQNRKE